MRRGWTDSADADGCSRSWDSRFFLCSCRWLINPNRLRQRKGLAALDGSAGAQYDIEPALDRLADVLRQQLDMERIRRLLSI